MFERLCSVHQGPRQNTRLLFLGLATRGSRAKSLALSLFLLRLLFSIYCFPPPMFFARSSRQASPESPNNAPANGNSQSSARPSNHQRDNSQPSSASPAPRISRDSESYPSWLPRRPPPPAPASTMHSSNSVPEPDPDTDAELFASIGGRKPTPRSVRIVSLQGVIPPGSRKPCRRRTDTSRPRGWSRATAPRLSVADGQGGFSYPYYTSLRIPQPTFNAKTLDLKTIVTPSFLARLYFNLFPFLAFTHLPLQTYFDFNAVFVLIECVPLSPSSTFFRITPSYLSQSFFDISFGALPS